MSELESDVKLLQDDELGQQVHLTGKQIERKHGAVQELSEQNQRLLDQLNRVSHELKTYGIRKKNLWYKILKVETELLFNVIIYMVK